MAAVLCVGSSNVYGVGGTMGGWPDYLKRLVHEEQYSEGGIGEVDEVYNLGIPGESTDSLLRHLETDLLARIRPMQPSTVVAIRLGGNDAKAVDTPENFVSTPERFQEQLRRIFTVCRKHTEKLLIVGLTPVDETKTCPKATPRTGALSYFYNSRIALFEDAIRTVSERDDVACVPLFSAARNADWPSKLYKDGLHPNDDGYRWIAEQVCPVLKPLRS